jgi:hypothetical protein
MAGRVVVSTLNNDTGVLATQNGMTGIAKAWVNFVGSNAAINASFNVSSVTRVTAGLYTINMTTALPSANYCVVAQSNNNTTNQNTATNIFQGGTPTTSSFFIQHIEQSVVNDPVVCCVAVFSS